MNVLEKRVSHREVFVTMGCAMYPYARIKEMLKDHENGVNVLDVIRRLQLADDDKMVLLQRMLFFNDQDARRLSLRFAQLTYENCADELTDTECVLAITVLNLLKQHVNENLQTENVERASEAIISYIDTELRHADFLTVKKRLGCLENILSVTKWNAQESLTESSSIQRDVLGISFAQQQLQEVEALVLRLTAD